MKKVLYIVFALTLFACMSCGERKTNLRVMSYNIRIGIGMDDSTSLERIADVINRVNPDFVGLQEVDSIAERSFRVDQAKELARLTGMNPVFAPATPRSDGLYGIAALVKKKPLAYRNVALPGLEEPRTFLILEYEDYILCNTHFSLKAVSRTESIDIINQSIGAYNKPIIITGDFNMLPQSDEYAKMIRNWTLLSDSTILTHPSDKPLWTLDYVFGRKGFTYQVTNSVVMNETMASDHLPLYIDVSITHP